MYCHGGSLKSADDSFHRRSKQNYESDSAEILKVAVYDNVLHDSNFIFIFFYLVKKYKNRGLWELLSHQAADLHTNFYLII